MVRKTKQERKYPDSAGKKTGGRPAKQKSDKVFKILIDGSNFLKQTYSSAEDAETAAEQFCQGSNSQYAIVESK